MTPRQLAHILRYGHTVLPPLLRSFAVAEGREASPARVKSGTLHWADGLVGYRGKRHTAVIDVDRRGTLDVADFWEPIKQPSAPKNPPIRKACSQVALSGISIQPASGMVTSLGMGILQLSKAMITTTPGQPMAANRLCKKGMIYCAMKCSKTDS